MYQESFGDIQKVELSKIGCFSSIEVSILREDLIHPFISGNKYRKLKYNLEEAIFHKKEMLLTFGGAYSNHISAVAYAGKLYGFKTLGIIRGEELKSKIQENSTLRFAESCGMEFVFIDRETYRKKEEPDFLINLEIKYPKSYIIPEGGTNTLAIKGCEEIITQELSDFDFICCSVGTGGTLAGLIKAKYPNQIILGFAALKDSSWLPEAILKYTSNKEYQLIDDYHFGGYAKITDELISFVNNFKTQYDIPLDPVYTGKMVFGVVDLIKKNRFREKSKILVVHTGGLQGIEGMNKILEKQNKQQII